MSVLDGFVAYDFFTMSLVVISPHKGKIPQYSSGRNA